MPTSDEIRALREEQRELLARVQELSGRIDSLEAQPGARPEAGAPEPGGGEQERVEPVRAEPKPPPLPPASRVTSDAEPPRREPPGQEAASVLPEEPVLEGPAPAILGNDWISRQIRKRVDAVRQQVQELGWEVSLGTYWLPRAAVVLIAIAVVLILSLALERWGAQWIRHARVAIGYGVCFGLLGLGWRFEKRYAAFARVLYAGGLALSYLVTFGTHYIPFSRIFASPVPTLLLLAVIVAAWGVVAQVRRSRVIAVLVTALGHFTILLSTVTLDQPSRFALFGVVMLGAGSAFFLLYNRWYYAAVVGMLGSYINHATFMAYSPGSDLLIDFVGAIGILSVYLLIFALAELFAPEELRRERVPTWFRSLFVTINTGSFFILGTLIMSNFTFTRDHQDAFRFVSSALLMTIALAYLLRRKRDPLYNTYMTKAVVALTLGLAARYSRDSLSAWLAIETVVLLYSARRSGLLVTRILASLVACCAFAHGLYTVALMNSIPYDAPEYFVHLPKALLTIVAFLVASQLYERTNWTLSSPTTAPAWFTPELRTLCWRLDLLSEPPSGNQTLRKPLQGLLFPFLYAFGGAVLLLAFATRLVNQDHATLMLAASALAFTVTAALRASKPFGAVGISFVPLVVLLASIDIGLGERAPLAIAALPAGLLAAVALASEERFLPDRGGLAYHRLPPSPFLLYGAATYLTGLLIVTNLGPFNECYVLIFAAIAAAALLLTLHPQAMACAATALLLWAAALYARAVTAEATESLWHMRLGALALVAAFLAADRYFSRMKERGSVPFLDAVLPVAAWPILLLYLSKDLPDSWRVAGIALVSFAYVGYGLAFRSKAALVVSCVGALISSLAHVAASCDLPAGATESVLEPGLVAGFVLLAAYWILAERLYARWPYGGDAKTRRNVTAVLIAFCAGLLLVMLERIPDLGRLNETLTTISWFGLAVFLLILSIPFKQPMYRYLGLSVILLAIARAFLVDMRETDTLFRIAAFAVLGAGLLPISYAYFRWRNRLRGK